MILFVVVTDECSYITKLVNEGRLSVLYVYTHLYTRHALTNNKHLYDRTADVYTHRMTRWP